MIQKTDPDNKVWTYGYDTYGNRNRAVDPLGNTTTYVYDSAGRMTSRVAPNGNVAGGNPTAFTTSYAYNVFGDMLTQTDPLCTSRPTGMTATAISRRLSIQTTTRQPMGTTSTTNRLPSRGPTTACSRSTLILTGPYRTKRTARTPRLCRSATTHSAEFRRPRTRW